MMQQVTLRLPAALASAIDQKRGTETVTNYIKRVLAERVSSDQDRESILSAISESRAAILKSINSLVSE